MENPITSEAQSAISDRIYDDTAGNDGNSNNDGKVEQYFATIALPTKVFKEQVYTTYHVYKDQKKFEEIEAISASEAIKQSGVEKPFKVIRTSCDLGATLAEDLFEKQEKKTEETEGAEEAEEKEKANKEGGQESSSSDNKNDTEIKEEAQTETQAEPNTESKPDSEPNQEAAQENSENSE